MISEFAQYLELPWVDGATGPDAYDCKGFFRLIQHVHFGIDVPEIIIPDGIDAREFIGITRDAPQDCGWVPVQAPQHGDLVLVHNPRHVGTWIDVPGGSGVLHSVPGVGVTFTRHAAWHISGFGRREYFRHRSRL